MPADRFVAHSRAGAPAAPNLVPDLFETGSERLPSSGQLGAASVAGGLLFILELLVAPLVLVVTLVSSVLAWWLFAQSWSGRRRVSRRRLISSRSLYLGTLMLIGMWLSVMFIFRASDPSLSSGFTATLPMQVLGLEVPVLRTLNGMRTARVSNAPVAAPPSGVAPFSLFVHGVASTLAVAFVAYAVATGRRRLRRRLRHGAMRERGLRGSSTAT